MNWPGPLLARSTLPLRYRPGPIFLWRKCMVQKAWLRKPAASMPQAGIRSSATSSPNVRFGASLTLSKFHIGLNGLPSFTKVKGSLPETFHLPTFSMSSLFGPSRSWRRLKRSTVINDAIDLPDFVVLEKERQSNPHPRKGDPQPKILVVG